ncbi:MAG: CBS domain-containing protein [Planctomycetota bacterium]|nr:MAG: CBS domain-containing protein [Planctomycetota bacterium]
MGLTAADIMTRPVTTIRHTETVESLIRLLRESHFTGVPVVDDEGRALGLVSETDILRALAYALSPPGSDELRVPSRELDAGRDRTATARLLRPLRGFERSVRELVSRQVRELMSPVLHSCRPEDPLHTVCQTMTWKEVHRIVVVDGDGKVVGLISSSDAVRTFGELLSKGELPPS